jgi:catechol 2,3-dioxygenase-like lactoylglutathione lyase family enzyme
VLVRTAKHWWGAVLDAPDPLALARFYADLLGWRIATEEPRWVVVAPPDGVAYLGFQASPEYVPPVWPPADGRQQQMFHLDLEVADLDASVAAALAAGATLPEHQPQQTVRVLLDPAGHPFCLYLDTAATTP